MKGSDVTSRIKEEMMTEPLLLKRYYLWRDVMDERVRSYLDHLPSPQKEICKRIRDIIFKTFPNMEESFKNGVPWYEDKYYIVGLKDHVNIGFSVKDLTKDEMDLFEGKGRFMRHIKIHFLDEVDEGKIASLLKVVK